MIRYSKEEVDSWPSGYKKCNKCSLLKPLGDFSRHKTARFGVMPECKICRRPSGKLAQESFKRKPVAFQLWSRAKRRAKLKQLPFTIKVEDIHIPEVCPVFGKPFVIDDPRWAPSLDQHEPGKGYTVGNIIVMSRRANHLKNNATGQELLAVAKYLLGQCDV